MNMPDLKNEIWLAKRVCGTKVCALFSGVTNVPIRCERMRQAILERGLEESMIGNSTYAAAFQRLYGEPLLHEVAA